MRGNETLDLNRSIIFEKDQLERLINKHKKRRFFGKLPFFRKGYKLLTDTIEAKKEIIGSLEDFIGVRENTHEVLESETETLTPKGSLMEGMQDDVNQMRLSKKELEARIADIKKVNKEILAFQKVIAGIHGDHVRDSLEQSRDSKAPDYVVEDWTQGKHVVEDYNTKMQKVIDVLNKHYMNKENKLLANDALRINESFIEYLNNSKAAKVMKSLVDKWSKYKSGYLTREKVLVKGVENTTKMLNDIDINLNINDENLASIKEVISNRIVIDKIDHEFNAKANDVKKEFFKEEVVQEREQVIGETITNLSKMVMTKDELVNALDNLLELTESVGIASAEFVNTKKVASTIKKHIKASNVMKTILSNDLSEEGLIEMIKAKYSIHLGDEMLVEVTGIANIKKIITNSGKSIIDKYLAEEVKRQLEVLMTIEEMKDRVMGSESGDENLLRIDLKVNGLDELNKRLADLDIALYVKKSEQIKGKYEISIDNAAVEADISFDMEEEEELTAS
ncbi:MAG: hypothetical protein N4A47_03190 [Clostridia bacterium]|nr:hypothetical protein [Clostridia bacterium]